jgi:hypothetical protein
MSEDTLQRDFGRLEGKLDILLERTSSSASDHLKLTHRVTKLETQGSIIKVTAGVIGAIAAIVASLFSGYFVSK